MAARCCHCARFGNWSCRLLVRLSFSDPSSGIDGRGLPVGRISDPSGTGEPGRLVGWSARCLAIRLAQALRRPSSDLRSVAFRAHTVPDELVVLLEKVLLEMTVVGYSLT